MSKSRPRMALTTLVLSLVVTLTMTTQAYAADALIYNPFQMLNSSTSTYDNHPVTYFLGWANRFARDLNSLGEYADAPVYLAGSGWSTAIVKTGADGVKFWPVYRETSPGSGVCQWVGDEYAFAVTLVLPNGSQTAGFSLSHLSGYGYGDGQSISNGAHVANLSWLSYPGRTYHFASCTSENASAPHLHIESARTGTTFNNDVDPISTAWWQPYWYYQYP